VLPPLEPGLQLATGHQLGEDETPIGVKSDRHVQVLLLLSRYLRFQGCTSQSLTFVQCFAASRAASIMNQLTAANVSKSFQ
jgi:hypothetical protein